MSQSSQSHILIHKHTQAQLSKLISHPAHAIALIGPEGVGKQTVAKHLITSVLGISIEKLATYPYFKVYEPERGSISIESARDIIAFTTLKTTGRNKGIRRVVLIQDAHLLTREAQNALLKTFEEPPSDTLLVLTVTETARILPTLLSRTTTLNVQAPEYDEMIDFFTQAGHNKADIVQYYHMSGGLPGLMYELLEAPEDHPLVRSVSLAKDVLRSDHFQRLTMIDSVVKEQQTVPLVQALRHVSRSALYIEAKRPQVSESVVRKWAQVLSAAEYAHQKLVHNGQAKLVLTDLFLQI